MGVMVYSLLWGNAGFISSTVFWGVRVPKKAPMIANSTADDTNPAFAIIRKIPAFPSF